MEPLATQREDEPLSDSQSQPQGALTEPCRRAIESDSAPVPPAVTLGASSYFALATALSARSLLRTDGGLLALLNLQGLPAVTALVRDALVYAATGQQPSPREHGGLLTAASAGAVLRAAAAVLLALLSYCPLGRLAFARPLRRLAVRLAHVSARGDTTDTGGRIWVALTAALRAVRSPQGVLVASNVLVLPALARALVLVQRRAAAAADGSRGGARLVGAAARTLGIAVTGLRVALTVCSGVATYTLLRPQHLIPTNPWLSEPGAAAGSVALRPDDPRGQRVGVLLCNLGTTASPRPQDVRRFLRPFLSDPRVVEIMPAVWLSVLNTLILPTRQFSSGSLYQRFTAGMETEGNPPLIYYTQKLAEKMQVALGGAYDVETGMRYGQPSISEAVRRLKARGCQQVILLTAYPQYSGTTSASIYDEAFARLAEHRFVPALRVVRPYFTHPGYINAVAAISRDFFAQHAPFDYVLLSFHGIPERYHLRGDPYPFHCEATARAVADALNLRAGTWKMTYQSVFGKDPWLLPATDTTVQALAETGHKRLAIICPGFLADCLETVDENGYENRHIFLEHGGEELHVAPCLNADDRWAEAAATLVREEAAGWVM